MGNPNIAEEGKKHQWKPGQSGNPKGMPKGAKQLSTWIQELANDEAFVATIIDEQGKEIEYKGAPIKAIVGAAFKRSLAGDQKWADWLAKYGYGTKVEHSGSVDINRHLSEEELDAIIGRGLSGQTSPSPKA